MNNQQMRDSEKETLRQLQKGSVQAFDELYVHYYPKAEKFAVSILKEKAVAEDIVQNVFTRLWERRSESDSIKSFSSYLFISTRNAIYDWLSKKSVKFEMPGNIDNYRELIGGDLSKEVEAADLMMMIEIALTIMPKRRSEAFLLSRKEGMTYSEIAKKLGISQKTVEYHISQALQDLKKVIQAIVLFFI